jgi:hypothetical protein
MLIACERASVLHYTYIAYLVMSQKTLLRLNRNQLINASPFKNQDSRELYFLTIRFVPRSKLTPFQLYNKQIGLYRELIAVVMRS